MSVSSIIANWATHTGGIGRWGDGAEYGSSEGRARFWEEPPKSQEVLTAAERGGWGHVKGSHCSWIWTLSECQQSPKTRKNRMSAPSANLRRGTGLPLFVPISASWMTMPNGVWGMVTESTRCIGKMELFCKSWLKSALETQQTWMDKWLENGWIATADLRESHHHPSSQNYISEHEWVTCPLN